MISHAMHHMDPMDEFSLANFKANRVIPAYAHDGSENIRDEFEVKITDGSHVSRKLLVRYGVDDYAFGPGYIGCKIVCLYP